jgi:hypothetical protein
MPQGKGLTRSVENRPAAEGGLEQSPVNGKIIGTYGNIHCKMDMLIGKSLNIIELYQNNW